MSGMYRIDLVQGRDHWRALMNIVKNNAIFWDVVPSGSCWNNDSVEHLHFHGE
jgi:hypothetical protein